MKPRDNYGQNNYSQPPQSNQPAYNYRDQSLSPSSQANSNLYRRKRHHFLLLRLCLQALFVVFPVAGATLLTSHYTSVYQTYQEGTCTLSDGQVVEHDSKDKYGHITSRSYYPSFAFSVHTKGDGDVDSSGYDGPTRVDYYEQSDAQDIIDRYQSGENVNCWYNPHSPEKAYLIFYGYQTGDRMSTFFWSIAALTGFAICIYLLFNWTVWRLFALWRRGVVTQGIVARHEQKHSQHSTYMVSIISYQVWEEQRHRELTTNGALSLKKTYPVCYDPLFPRYRRFGAWPASLASLPGIITISLLVMTAFAITSYVWWLP